MNSEQAELELLRDQAPTAFEEAVRQLWPSVVKAKTNLTGESRLQSAGINFPHISNARCLDPDKADGVV